LRRLFEFVVLEKMIEKMRVHVSKFTRGGATLSGASSQWWRGLWRYLPLAFVLVFCCSATSCADAKTSYLTDLRELVQDVQTNQATFTEEKWTSVDHAYHMLVEERYQQVKAQLSDEDKQEVGKLKADYLALKWKHDAANLMNDLNDGLQELKGAVNGIVQEVVKSLSKNDSSKVE
jgi:hypothetical protein